MSKVGVILANTGTPEEPTPEAVRSYLSEFLSDERIRPMNPLFWGLILRLFILPKRSQASAEKYAKIWTPEGSPLKVHMQSLAQKVADALGDGEDDFAVSIAMAYGEPSVETAFSGLIKQGCTRFVVVPLYPQSAFSTTEVIRDKTLAAMKRLELGESSVSFVESYGDREEYARAIASSLLESGFSRESNDRVLFTFHSIPQNDIDNGDTYVEEVAESMAAILNELDVADDQWAVGFQCRFDKSRSWLSPFSKPVLEELAPGAQRVFVVTPNFAIDCLETLFDIDIELREYARENDLAAGDDFVYVPCLNDSEEHARLLANIVLEA